MTIHWYEPKFGKQIIQKIVTIIDILPIAIHEILLKMTWYIY